MTQRRKAPKALNYDVLEKEAEQYLAKSAKTVKVLMRRVEAFPDLKPREKEFAMRYVMKVQPYRKWAEEFGCSYITIQKMMNNPKVRQLMDDLRFDIRTYAMAGMMVGFRKAIQQIIRILDLPDFADNLEVKSKIALKLLEFYNKREGNEDEKEIRPGLHVNIFTGEVEKQTGEKKEAKQTVSVEVVKEQTEELKALQQNANIIKLMKEAEDGNE